MVPEKEDKSYIEPDVEKLCKYVCINYNVEGTKRLSDEKKLSQLSVTTDLTVLATEPGPAIKPDSEYPEWLFKLDVRPPRELEDLDPETDGWLYWRALQKRQFEQERRHKKLKLKYLALMNSPTYNKLKQKSKFKIRGGSY